MNRPAESPASLFDVATPADEDRVSTEQSVSSGAVDAPFRRSGTLPAAAASPDVSGQWRLSRIDVVNWGTFNGHHVVDVPRTGLVITGDSGTGKSSLLDAVTTVLTPRPKVRYNAAAQDQSVRASDRSLVSYIRGAWRSTDAEDADEVRSDFLRAGACWSGVRLRFDTADGQDPVVLVKLFKLNRGQMSSGDVKEICVLAREDLDLANLGAFVSEAVDIRGLKKEYPQATITEKHSVFQQRFQRFLGIVSDSAILLLHRTMAAKNLGSLDALFREYMLDEPKTFAAADMAVEQFSELSQAHRSVVEARRQLDVLDTIAELLDRWETASGDSARIRALAEALDPVTNEWIIELAEKELDRAQAANARAEGEQRQASTALTEAQRDQDAARSRLRESGGAELENQQALLAHVRREHERITRTRERLEARIRTVGIESLPDSWEEFAELQRTGQKEAADTDLLERLDNAKLAAHDRLRDLRQTRSGLEADRDAARRQQSNLDRRLLAARTLIARSTGLNESALPFAGELMEVRPEHTEWTGAIERVLRPLSRTILVEDRHLPEVTRALDEHHFGTRVVVESVPAEVPAPRALADDRSLVYRVDLKDWSPKAAWLRTELARRYDYSCVGSTAELTGVDRGLTRAGQVKRGPGRFEKDDRWRVDDPSTWVMGFSAEDKVVRLLEQLEHIDRQIANADEELEQAVRRHAQAQERRRLMVDLADTDWADLDITAASAAISAVEHRIETLTAASAGLAAAQRDLDAAEKSLAAAQARCRDADREHARIGQELKAVTRALDDARADLGRTVEGQVDAEHTSTGEVPVLAVTSGQRDVIRTRIRAAKRHIEYFDLVRLSKNLSSELQREEKAADRARSEAETGFTAAAGEFRRTWPGVSADLTGSVDDRGGYRELRSRLKSDGLPEFEDRFAQMLRKQSTQNMGKLNTMLRNAAQEIRARVDPVNTSLLRSQFDVGRYLQIRVKTRFNADVRDLMQKLQTVTSGGLSDIEPAEAERKFAVMEEIITRLQSSEPADLRWRRACLDTRRHVSFVGVDQDAEGEVVSVYESAAGLSGGQRQKLVVFCLAAALRYQLTDGAEDVPRFGTVFLDEAFDRADQDFARMAMDIFVAFGFHMILVTPKKLLQTLEDYVGGITLVRNSDRRDSQLSRTTWDDA